MIAILMGVAALFCGLWIGELRRNADLRALLKLRDDRPAAIYDAGGRAMPKPERGKGPPPEPVLLQDEREQLIADIMLETGVDEKRARAEAERILHMAAAIGGDG